MQATLKME